MNGSLLALLATVGVFAAAALVFFLGMLRGFREGLRWAAGSRGPLRRAFPHAVLPHHSSETCARCVFGELGTGLRQLASSRNGRPSRAE